MKKTIFYSWQSDLDHKDNRNFIENCIRQAIKELNRENEFDIELRIDKDTSEEGGTPDITETIFSKIAKAAFFIADISIINHGTSEKKTPNPNVLIELGYAAKALGWERIICVFNKDYGSLDELPFDLRNRRLLSYNLRDKDRSSVKKEVVSALKDNISYSKLQDVTTQATVGHYVILEANTLYEYFENQLAEILSRKSIQERFPFIKGNYMIEMWDDLDYRLREDLPSEETDIEYVISVVFTDDSYSHGEYTNQECSIFISLRERFKQINFRTHKVCSAYEITSSGYSPSGLGRNYAEVSEEILKYIK